MLKIVLNNTAEKCIDCGKCELECLFLKNTGSPGVIARQALASENDVNDAAIRAYDCSTCSLCSAVCPVDAMPAEVFTELRNHAQTNDLFDLKKYSPLLGYEKLGRRFPFKDSIVPKGCETVFFPGCTLPALFPEATRAAYAAIKQSDPKCGLILNCCSKPSKMLGLAESFEQELSVLISDMESKGIKRVLTACPNCHVTLKNCKPGLAIVSIYEELLKTGFTPVSPCVREVTVHDPCVIRFEATIHESVRDLLKLCGITVVEMKHSREKTLCCGEGGALHFHNAEYPANWSRKRIAEAEKTGAPIATYCAGCANYLSPGYPVAHVLDLAFVERKEVGRTTAFPMNYLNRLKLRVTARTV